MSTATDPTDLEVFTSLEKLDKLVTRGIEKVEDLTQDVWSKDTFSQIRTELIQTREELEQARKAIADSQQAAKKELESLKLAVADASAQRSSLAKIGSEYAQLCTDLAEQGHRGQACLTSLTRSIQSAAQVNEQVDAAIQRIASAQAAISEVDRKYKDISRMKAQIVGIVDLMGNYDSFEALLSALRGATDRLDRGQAVSQASLQGTLEPINQKINTLIAAQRKPWWSPDNWWWKKRASFTQRQMLAGQERGDR